MHSILSRPAPRWWRGPLALVGAHSGIVFFLLAWEATGKRFK
jgi:hypothetical protein